MMGHKEDLLLHEYPPHKVVTHAHVIHVFRDMWLLASQRWPVKRVTKSKLSLQYQADI